MVSQLDMLDLMVQDPDLLGTFPRTATMESLGLTRGAFSVAAVTSDFSVAGCFALMHNSKVSGVAVLDEHGRFMIGSISASDVRRVTCANDLADALMSTVGEFSAGPGVVQDTRQGESTPCPPYIFRGHHDT